MFNFKKKDFFMDKYVGNLTFKGRKSNSVKFIDEVFSIIKFKNIEHFRKRQKSKSKFVKKYNNLGLNFSPYKLCYVAFKKLYPFVGIKRLKVGRSKKIKRYIYLPMRLKDKRKAYTVFQWTISQDRKKRGIIYKRGVSVEEVASNWLNAFKNDKYTNIMRRKFNLLQLLLANKYRMKRVKKKRRIIFKNIKPKEWLPLEYNSFKNRLKRKKLRKKWRRRNIMARNYRKARRKIRVSKISREWKNF